MPFLCLNYARCLKVKIFLCYKANSAYLGHLVQMISEKCWTQYSFYKYHSRCASPFSFHFNLIRPLNCNFISMYVPGCFSVHHLFQSSAAFFLVQKQFLLIFINDIFQSSEPWKSQAEAHCQGGMMRENKRKGAHFENKVTLLTCHQEGNSQQLARSVGS